MYIAMCILRKGFTTFFFALQNLRLQCFGNHPADGVDVNVEAVVRANAQHGRCALDGIVTLKRCWEINLYSNHTATRTDKNFNAKFRNDLVFDNFI